MVIYTHKRTGELISRQDIPDDCLDTQQDADEFDQAAKLLFEMVYHDVEQSA